MLKEKVILRCGGGHGANQRRELPRKCLALRGNVACIDGPEPRAGQVPALVEQLVDDLRRDFELHHARGNAFARGGLRQACRVAGNEEPVRNKGVRRTAVGRCAALNVLNRIAWQLDRALKRGEYPLAFVVGKVCADAENGAACVALRRFPGFVVGPTARGLDVIRRIVVHDVAQGYVELLRVRNFEELHAVADRQGAPRNGGNTGAVDNEFGIRLVPLAVTLVENARDAPVLKQKIGKRSAENKRRACFLRPAVQAGDVAVHMHADDICGGVLWVAVKGGEGSSAGEFKREVVVPFRQWKPKTGKIGLGDMKDVEPAAEGVLGEFFQDQNAVPCFGDFARKVAARRCRANNENVVLLHNFLQRFGLVIVFSLKRRNGIYSLHCYNYSTKKAETVSASKDQP